MINYQTLENENQVIHTFLKDVLRGLSQASKHLDSKYFYDTAGDELFRQIMHCPEYYPTRCELEIFSGQIHSIIQLVLQQHPQFDLVELGPGDALKSVHLLRNLLRKNVPFTYYPIDISKNAIDQLNSNLPGQLPGLKIHGLNGEYFEMLQQLKTISDKPKLVLFLGSNIGNMFPQEATIFCHQLQQLLMPGDLVLIGFDLKKNPQTILNAYNDKQGITRKFNLNLLKRINRELDADFREEQFQHYPIYDPETGACRSYLVSLKDQTVQIGPEKKPIEFLENECILMEISQKYTVHQSDELAHKTGFTPLAHFYDSKKWFLDALWRS
ncbi:MAG TPA: L-histidine N(alpha)-methyltransferase [Daejeonella sp.]|nr:L-histidine N(alpha)-methyltransferase [Daejeonella sp.]